jgi:cytochrome c-type biogenesis protein CcmF
MQWLPASIHLLPGQIGHFFVIFTFVSAVLACVSYFFAAKRTITSSQQQNWLRLGRWSFAAHVGGVVAVILLLFYIINAQLFEYHYAWQHSSSSLPVYYQFASFWEGQEGSFLLWAFWHAVLGGVLIFTARQWEAPVLTFLCMAQVFIFSMILGIYVLGYRVGSSPFILLRDALTDAPIFEMNPDFVPEDGSGLNPVLQNYWMVIHPPVLFLGFASGIIPFCYAMSGLWQREYKKWLKLVCT